MSDGFGNDIFTVLAALMLASMAAAQEQEAQARRQAALDDEQHRAEQQRAEKKAQCDREKEHREFEARWDVKTQRQIDAAKAAVKLQKFSPAATRAICARLDCLGGPLAEITEGAIQATSRKAVGDEISLWERDLSALAAADRGLIPGDDRRVEAARTRIAELVSAHETTLAARGLDAPTAGVLSVDWESLADRARRGAEDAEAVAAAGPGGPSEDRSTAIEDLRLALDKRADKGGQGDKGVQRTAPTSPRPNKDTDYGMGF